jgi:hypothetical protein
MYVFTFYLFKLIQGRFGIDTTYLFQSIPVVSLFHIQICIKFQIVHDRRIIVPIGLPCGTHKENERTPVLEWCGRCKRL